MPMREVPLSNRQSGVVPFVVYRCHSDVYVMSAIAASLLLILLLPFCFSILYPRLNPFRVMPELFWWRVAILVIIDAQLLHLPPPRIQDYGKCPMPRPLVARQ